MKNHYSKSIEKLDTRYVSVSRRFIIRLKTWGYYRDCVHKLINTVYTWRHSYTLALLLAGQRRLQAFQSMSLSATFVYSQTFLPFAASRCCSASCIVSMLIIRLPEAILGCILVGERWNKATKRLHTTRANPVYVENAIWFAISSFFSLDLYVANCTLWPMPNIIIENYYLFFNDNVT